MKEKYWRYRIITNLHCNQSCYFCYQPLKEKKILDIDKLKTILNKTGYKKRATIMGGESMLLDNLPEYIEIVKKYADKVCLITNGTLLNSDNLIQLKEVGLDELAISVHSIEQYLKRRSQIILASSFIKNCRVNLPKSWESVGDKLYNLIKIILVDNIYVEVCEDLMGRYGQYDFEKSMGAKYVGSDGYNFLSYSYNGKHFGVFAAHEGYDKTDVIISPLGVFVDWVKYCKKVGNDKLS